ncbi:amnion associated transmembrane protein [Arctopsyche grandis]|uniref:amnion associated transmembrane protein n=1 Tax=Arctopsyche grandis TaxID=121162 RepID=UPI00406D9B53
MYKLTLFLTIIYAVFARKPTEKIWVPDVNFENPENWSPKRVPCSSDRIMYSNVFDEEIHLTKNDIEVREIILPLQGSIKLKQVGVIKLTDASDKFPDCKGEDLVFKKNIKEPWMLSSNWKSVDIAEVNKAVPHYERLPCQDDGVIFPHNKTFVLQMPHRLQNVKSIGDEFIKETEPLQLYDIFQENPLVFQEIETEVSPSVMLSSNSKIKTCSIRESCPCQTKSIPSELCLNEIKSCPPLECLNPVIPKNHCCEICGGVLLFNQQKDFNVGLLQKEIEEKIDEWKIKGIQWHVGTVSENEDTYNIQIVIVENSLYDGRSVDLAKRLKQYFAGRLNFTNNVMVSGMPWSETKGGWEGLIMLFVVAIFFAGLLMYYYSPSDIISARPFRPLGFARFENRSREGSLMLGVSQLSLDKAFDNPLYDKNTARSTEDVKFKEEPLNESDTEEELVDPISEKENL